MKLEFGWWSIPYIAYLILGIIIILLLSLSPYVTRNINLYNSFKWIPLLMFASAIGFQILTGGPGKGIAIFPVGLNDPDTYPLQRVSYNFALAVALIVSILLGIFFYTSVSVTHEVWVPVPRMLVRGMSVSEIPTNTRTFFSGRNEFGNAIADSFAPTYIENPLLLYSPMILWVIVRLILRFMGTPDELANSIGMITYILIVTITFPYVFHAWAYESAQPKYIKAATFAFSCSVPTALTGFPVCDLPHFMHNWGASTFKTIGNWVNPIPKFILSLKNNMVIKCEEMIKVLPLSY